MGYKAKLVRQVMLDSRLAVMQTSSFENMEMFDDQQALCDWMHDAVAMHPFTTPSEMQREAVPVSSVIRTLYAKIPNDSAASTQHERSNEISESADLAKSGRERRLVVHAGKDKQQY